MQRLLRSCFIFYACMLLSPLRSYGSDDFQSIDSLACTIKYDGDIVKLTKQLTAPYTDQVQKARAIYAWITWNIAYDYKYANKHDAGSEISFDCPSDDSLACVIKEQVWENSYINKALDRKKAICQGYSMLFKRMCEIAGLHAEVVPGYTRTEDYQVGTVGDLNHAWNAVQLNGNYYLLDLTWAAGGCMSDGDKLIAYFRQRNDYWWLTPPEEFAKTHFPEDPKWVLLPKYTQATFAANPYYAMDEVDAIHLISPVSGLIKAKTGDTIKFKLTYPHGIYRLQINTNLFQNPDTFYYTPEHRRDIRVTDSLALKKQQYVAFVRNDETYEFSYVVKDNSLEWLDILFDRRKVLRFKIARSSR